MNMTRFRDAEDPGFEKVSNQIWLCVQGISKRRAAVDTSPPQSPTLAGSRVNSGGSGSGRGPIDNRGSNGGVFKYSSDSFKNVSAGRGARIGL